MFKKIKQLFCDHRKVVYYGADLVRQDDGYWVTAHKWKCKKCGKVIGNETTQKFDRMDLLDQRIDYGTICRCLQNVVSCNYKRLHAL